MEGYINLYESFEGACEFLQKPKLLRWMSRPFKHGLGFFWSYFCYRVTGTPLKLTSRIFTGDQLSIPIPAGLDLYPTGVKSHDSELRLVRYILSSVNTGDIVIDAGAHLGYYRLVLAACVGDTGKVIAFEPGASIARYLDRNAGGVKQIQTVQAMLSDEDGNSSYLEFPILYSEFNTGVTDAHPDFPRQRRTVQAYSLDGYCNTHEIQPVFLKIDVEGGEHAVLRGAVKTMSSLSSIAIEIRKDEYDELYAPVDRLLKESGYKSYRIADDGSLVQLGDLRDYIALLPLESDNIVFCKESP
jgi:FkbM family methyltransferase